MTFSCSVDINAPIGTVVSLFDNIGNMKKWQDGFKSHEHISGIPGTAGAKSKLVYDTGKHVIELTETIQNKQLPKEMTALYEHTHMVNTLTTSFTELPGGKTRYTTTIDYTKFIGFMPKLMSILMPGVFKKQAQKWADQFKVFVEQAVN